MAQPPVHWVCPDCGQPCTCTEPAVRGLVHERCGLPPDATVQQGIDKGYADAAAEVKLRRLYPDALEDGI